MAKLAFYAVRKGRTPGVYVTWKECEAQVKGFPNAEYKKFELPSEADAYLAGAGALSIDDICLEDVLLAYTDGSFLADAGPQGSAGYGAVFVWNDQVIGKLHGGITGSQSRNINGEIQAVVAAVKTAKARGVKEIVICHDLMHVQMWADGLWKANTEESQEYVKFIQQQRSEGMFIGFGWIHGHQGNVYNEMADEEAGLGARELKKAASGFPREKGPFTPPCGAFCG